MKTWMNKVITVFSRKLSKIRQEPYKSDTSKQWTPYDYFILYAKTLSNKTDSELIESVNNQVGFHVFGYGRQGVFMALKDQLKKRNIDFSVMGDEKSVSYGYVVVLKGKKLYRISNLKKSEVVELFDTYLEINHPEKLQLNPEIISYNNEEITFRMDNHAGFLKVQTKDVVRKGKNYL